jgi:hypothetical protein
MGHRHLVLYMAVASGCCQCPVADFACPHPPRAGNRTTTHTPPRFAQALMLAVRALLRPAQFHPRTLQFMHDHRRIRHSAGLISDHGVDCEPAQRSTRFRDLARRRFGIQTSCMKFWCPTCLRVAPPCEGIASMPRCLTLEACPPRDATPIVYRQLSASGSRDVSLLASMATSATPAAPTRYHAGASLLPVIAISQVATSGAVPPNNAFAALKQKAKPL